MAVVRVLVVDDQADFLRAMTSVVRETPGFEVVGEACGCSATATTPWGTSIQPSALSTWLQLRI